MPCSHIYKNIGLEICPDCGRYTHETDFIKQNQLHKQWIEDGKNKEFICPVEGGGIRGWWSI